MNKTPLKAACDQGSRAAFINPSTWSWSKSSTVRWIVGDPWSDRTWDFLTLVREPLVLGGDCGADASYITGGFRPAEDAHSRDHF